MIIRQSTQQRQTQSTKVDFDDIILDDQNFIVESESEISTIKEDRVLKQSFTLKDDSSGEAYGNVKNSEIDYLSTGSYHTYLFSTSSINSHYLYNYEFKEYENISRTKGEKELPSGLIFNYLRSESIVSGYLKSNSYSIGGAIAFNEVKNQTTSYLINNYSNLLFDKSLMDDYTYGPEIKTYKDNYYKTYTDKHLDFQFGEPDNQWLKKQKNIFVLFKPEYKLDYYPYWVFADARHLANDLELSSIKEAIMEGGLTKLLFSYIKNTEAEEIEFNQSENLKTWDVFDWLDSELVFEEKEDEIYLVDSKEPGVKLNSYLEFKIKKVIAKTRIINLAIKHTPTFDDIIKTKPNCKSLIIGYKIEKMRFRTGPVLQTIYYEGTKAKFLDTQLCYDKRYFYKVSELRIVIGANYEYKLKFNDDEKKIEFDFLSFLSMKIVEKECQLFAHRIVTPPLFSPDVEVVNELTSKNVVKFLLSDHIRNTGTYYDKFEIVTSLDEEYYNYAKQAGYINNKGHAIYSHRSSTGNFEVYRIDFMPEKYRDFADGFLGVFSDSNPEITDKSLSMTFTDYIKHEKVYYYMFRSLSHHNKPGKPSLVFKCELVQDADEIILKSESFDLFDKKEEFDNTKEFRKFIQILPALRHVAFKDEFNILYENRPLGIDTDDDNDAIWDYGNDKNYFKIRIKSKKTGKKFDLNLRFMQIKNNS